MNYRCFQYMCYPWSKGSSTFRSCKRRSDCQGLEEEEAGNGEDGDCYRYFSIDFPHCILWFIFQPHFRHQDRRFVFSGICLANRYFLDILRNHKAEHVSKVSLCVLHNCVLRSKNMMSEDYGVMFPAPYKLVQYILPQQEISFLTRRAIFLFQLFSNL